ncbi:TPA: hypothetical protein I7566_05155 [Vibrio cholerae]|nr:hypothetical protein [Vibrio cholerae]HAS7885720.1 hypothetical protein [Vibrio cholerae]HAS7900886.1 hypothetical protein [Vibrio cholerae]HAS8013607.1 hypothetical protein [Vibrio cholerae]HAS8038470.1 hypothetical protein [Vibrio cholerae]
MSKEIELAEVFQDMEPNESMRDFAIRKSLEAKRSTDKVANLRDWIHQIAVNAGNEQFVIDATSKHHSSFAQQTEAMRGLHFEKPILQNQRLRWFKCAFLGH